MHILMQNRATGRILPLALFTFYAMFHGIGSILSALNGLWRVLESRTKQGYWLALHMLTRRVLGFLENIYFADFGDIGTKIVLNNNSVEALEELQNQSGTIDTLLTYYKSKE